jgi:hypothetical protein
LRSWNRRRSTADDRERIRDHRAILRQPEVRRRSLAFVAGWIVISSPRHARFDPYPFLLVAIVAIEALLISAFVLMNQNRMTVLAERAHLGLPSTWARRKDQGAEVPAS